MKEIIKQHQMELKKLLPEFNYKGCNKQTILNWHKQSLKQFIDGLVAWQQEEVRHPLETIEHLKEIRAKLK